MKHSIQPLRRSDMPILVRWIRGNTLYWGIIGSVMILRWLGDVSPFNIDAMTDGWAKTVVACLAGILTIAIVFFGLPLLLHELAFEVIAKPAIKETVARQDGDRDL